MIKFDRISDCYSYSHPIYGYEEISIGRPPYLRCHVCRYFTKPHQRYCVHKLNGVVSCLKCASSISDEYSPMPSRMEMVHNLEEGQTDLAEYFANEDQLKSGFPMPK